MKSNALRSTLPQQSQDGLDDRGAGPPAIPRNGFEPGSVRPPHSTNQPGPQSLWTYTEEQVSEILQVSISQLRKWRMKKNQSKRQGPPFRKIGRLVRYPEEGLSEYINGK
jgi:hypothetical protein